MAKQTLNLINKNNKKLYFAEIPKKRIKVESDVMLFGAGSNGNSTKDEVLGVTEDDSKSDEQKQNEVSDISSESDSEEVEHNMQQYISDMIDALTLANSGDIEINGGDDVDGVDANIIAGEGSEINPATNAAAWDPRLARMDGFVSDNQLIIPFASATAAGAYFEEVFTIERAAYDEATGGSGGGSVSSGGNGGNGGNGRP